MRAAVDRWGDEFLQGLVEETRAEKEWAILWSIVCFLPLEKHKLIIVES